jgi:hypothetical protein
MGIFFYHKLKAAALLHLAYLFRRGEPRFYALDLLWCDGEDLRWVEDEPSRRWLYSVLILSKHVIEKLI